MKKIQLIPLIFLLILSSNLNALTYEFEQMWPVLDQPWYFYYPADLVSDNKGFLYIADTSNNRIRKFTTNGQFITQWGKPGNEDKEFNNPYAIAIDNKGFIYVADTFNHRIQKFSSDGEFILKWGKEGSNQGEFKKPYGITISPENYVYIADSNNDRIQLFTDTGIYLKQWGENLLFPSGMASDANGTIYIADTLNDRIQKIVNNSTLSIVNMNNIQLNQPKGIAVDEDSNIYIADYGNKRLVKINPNGDLLDEWDKNTSIGATFESLYGINIDSKGYVYTTDNNYHLIQKFSNNGSFIARWGTGDTNGMFNLPTGIAIENNGMVYVADTQNHRVQKFTSDGQFVTAWSGNESLTGQFTSPSDVAVGEINENQTIVFVSDKGENRIQLFSTDGQYLNQWGQTVLKSPLGIDLDSRGYLYVANQRGNNIIVFNSEGTVKKVWGERGSENGQFKSPYDVACDNRNPDQIFVYVADTSNNRIQKFSSSGDYITKWGSEGKEPGQFYYPTSLTVDPDGLVYVTDMETQRIQVFQPDGTFVTQWGEGGYHPGQLYDPAGLDIGPDGRIYIADTFHHRVQVFIKNDLLKKNTTQWTNKKYQSKDNETSQDKAIIVAGGGPYPGNDLWDATQLNTNYAYQVLIYNGFEKNQIKYLSHDLDLDLDANGVLDDIDFLPENNTLKDIITQWASDARYLFVFLVDHGGNNRFRINSKEILSDQMLDTWLDDLQSLYGVKTTVIIDACQSGSFVPALIPPLSHERITISSASTNESAYFLSNGYLSFSYQFWTRIFMGKTIGQAFYQATSCLDTHQHPQLDDNHDGQYDENDGILAQKRSIGLSPISFGDAPIILSISDHQTITQGATATINVYSITDKDSISRVWAAFYPPGFSTESSDQPIHSFPEIDLMPIEKGRYSGNYSGFVDSGTYTIIIYATDIYGNISLPAQTTVSIQNNHLPQAMIIAGHSNFTNMSTAMTKNVQLAHDALLFQGFSDDMIHILGPEWLTCSDNIATIDTFQSYVNHLQSEQAAELIIYMIGQGDSEIFDINASEILHAKILDQWLDEFQAHLTVPITLIYDASKSGSFMSLLKAEQQQKRIIITGTAANQVAQFIAQGAISFSQFFWRGVYNGFSIRDAFLNGQNGVAFSCNIQVPQLDDNGNGISNELLDGIVSQHRTIGSGIRLAENSPFIGTTNEYLNITQSHATITAKDVTATDSIQQMIAVIAPPCAAYTGYMQVITETVLDSSGQAYTFHTDQLDYTGDYQVTWFAVGKDGMISKPSVMRFSSASPLKDAYEPDNAWQDANVLIINDQNPYHLQIPGYQWQQHHNFHVNTDEDWFSFMAVNEEYYKISVEYEELQPEITIFASNQIIEITNTTIDVKDNVLMAEFSASYSDVYFVRIQSKNDLPKEQFQPAEYRINLTIPAGTFGGFIYGSISPVVKDSNIRTSAQGNALGNGINHFLALKG
ncbi:NHL repeat containing protein, partial [Candidatus Magnetomorum sp. HK-1]